MRERIVIGHPFIGRGGSEAALMWLIEALKDDFEITVVSTGGWNLEELNSYYGTQVEEAQVQVRLAPVPWPVRNLSAAALRGACYQRFARQIAGEYDVRISAYNPTDWGLPAIHFIADFSWLPAIRESIDPPSPGVRYRDSWLRRRYLHYAASYSNPSGRDFLKQDRVIANSQWSAKMIREHCGIDCAAVIYPPVWAPFPSVPWEDKEEAFVMIGRIAPEKQIERAIAILRAVRQSGHAIQLRLCGEIGNDPYGRTIAKLCRKNGDWIIAEGSVDGTRKSRLLTRCRYGIQTRSAEPFGISVAEMVKAGAIVFARNAGGPVEILENPALLFTDSADAAEKICALLENPVRQAAMHAHLTSRAQFFTADAFTRRVREYVETAGQVYV